MGFFHTIHEILTRDLTRQDFDKMLREDLRGMYEFYVRSMKSAEREPKKFKRAFKFTWHLFLAFLSKLTPARRFFYAIALVFILIALLENQTTSALYSFVIINILLALELADKLITKDELTVARDIQLSLQPNSDVTIPGYDLAAHSDVAKQVGGDYYDILPLPDHTTLVVIGDVSGKGISSALYVVKMQTALQLFATETSDPKELLMRLNTHVYGQLKRSYFLSLLLVKIHTDGQLEICRAGHPPALLYRSKEGSVLWLKPNGIAVGMAPSSNGGHSAEEKTNSDFGSSLEVQSLHIDKQDVLFLFTDGVSESADAAGKEFGTDRVTALIKLFAHEPIETIRDRLVDDLSLHRNGAELRDDTTFVLLKRT
jgi:sigma-B regulation protein RsbU (phosphoserine phosphatase)